MTISKAITSRCTSLDQRVSVIVALCSPRSNRNFAPLLPSTTSLSFSELLRLTISSRSYTRCRRHIVLLSASQRQAEHSHHHRVFGSFVNLTRLVAGCDLALAFRSRTPGAELRSARRFDWLSLTPRHFKQTETRAIGRLKKIDQITSEVQIIFQVGSPIRALHLSR